MNSSRPPPSSQAPALPPGGGNGKFIAVGALLLVGVGFVLWKQSQTSNVPPPQPTVPTATTMEPPSTTPEAKLDDVPPPPPIEDASIDAATVSKPVSAKGGGGFDPCAIRSCSGSSTPELETYLATRARQAKRCYEMELRNDPTLQGKVSVALRVAANGALCSATATTSDLPSVASCVERQFRGGASFPAPKNGCVEISVPIVFKPTR